MLCVCVCLLNVRGWRHDLQVSKLPSAQVVDPSLDREYKGMVEEGEGFIFNVWLFYRQLENRSSVGRGRAGMHVRWF